MRTKKTGKYKIILAISVASLLIICTYFAFIGDFLLPRGLIWQVTPIPSENEDILKSGALAVIDTQEQVVLPEIIAWQQGGKCHLGYAVALSGEQIVIDNQEQKVEKSQVLGKVTHTVAGFGYVVQAVRQGGAIVLVADFVFILMLLIYIVAAPKRIEEKRRAELQRLFEFYGDKYDLEDAGIDY